MSVFHFFAHLLKKKDLFRGQEELEHFPFDEKLIEHKWRGKFPDMALRVCDANAENPLRRGGELIELKSSRGYGVASFNSTIPTGVKNLADSDISLESATVLPVRQVYYLVRGFNKSGAVKVCLVHGSFFETVSAKDLITGAFEQAITAADKGGKLSEEEKGKFIAVMSEQAAFSTTRKVDNASVSLRFRVMSEVRKEANILKSYTEIGDDTLNLVVPLHGDSENARRGEEERINAVAKETGIWDENRPPFRIKHPLNGYFWVRQILINGANNA